MPDEHERGTSGRARGTGAGTKPLEAMLADQARRRRSAPLIDASAATASREALQRVKNSSQPAENRARDEFRFVGRSNALTWEPGGTSQDNVLPGDLDLTDTLPAPDLPMASTITPTLPTPRDLALLERAARRRLPPKTSLLQLYLYLWRLKLAEANYDPFAGEEPTSFVSSITDPHSVSLAGALEVLGTTTVGDARKHGLPLSPYWADADPLLNPHLTTSIIYVGPGFGAVFDTKLRFKPTPVGHSFHVIAAPNPGKSSWGNIYFTTRVNRGARGVQSWVLPMRPPEPAYRVGEFYLKLAEPTPTERVALRAWSIHQNAAVVYAISTSYYNRRTTLQGLSDGVYNLTQAVKRCVEQGYLYTALGDQLEAIKNMGIRDVLRLVLELVLTRYGVPTPGAIEGASKFGIAVGMAVWGADSPEGDLDVSARLLAPELAGMLIGAGVMFGLKTGKRVAKAAKKAAAPDTNPPAGERAPPDAPESTPKVAERGKDSGTPTDVERGLAPAKKDAPSVAPTPEAPLPQSMQVLRERGLVVRVKAIWQGAIELGRVALRILNTWYDGVLYRFKGILYVALDGIRNELVKIGRELDEWAYGTDGIRLTSVLGPSSAVGEALARYIYRWVRQRMRTTVSPAAEAFLQQLDNAAWTRLRNYAKGDRRADQIKGKIAEELIPHTPEFNAALAKARKQAELEGFAPDDVGFFRAVLGGTGSANPKWRNGELTDGLIAAIDRSTKPPIVRIYAVFEAKSPSNVRELGLARGGGTGQLAKDFDRFSEMPVEINGVRYEPGQVYISRYAGWFGYTPPGVPINPSVLGWIGRAFPNFKSVPNPVDNAVLQEVAVLFKRLLASDERPLFVTKGPKASE